MLVEKALAATGPLPDAIDGPMERYIDFYKKHPADETVVYAGVVEALETLAGRGVQMGICTNKPLAMTGLVLEALGLDRYFSAVTCGDAVPHRKPDGRHVLLTLDMMNAGAAHAVMVGDSETDVAAGKDAGLPVVAVSYGYAHVPIAELGVDAVIDSFAALPDTLDSLFSERFAEALP